MRTTIQIDKPGPTAPDAWPPRRRSFALPGMILAMATVAAVSGAIMVWHAPLAPDLDGGLRCTRAFDARLHTARGGVDADLLKLSDEASSVGCDRQAFEAADLVGEEAVKRLCATGVAPRDGVRARYCGR